MSASAGSILVTGWPLVEAAERLLREQGYEVEGTSPDPDQAEILSRLEEVNPVGLVVRTGVIDQSCFGAAGKLKVIANHGAGYDDVNVEEATRLGIPVFAAAGRNAIAVAEQVFALLLAVRKRITEYDALVRAGEWRPGKPATAELHGSVMGIVGLGAIGERVAELASAFSMEVVAFDPARDRSWPVPVGRCESLADLLTKSDVVSLHIPLTDRTRDLIDAKALTLMKPDAILVNTARGGIVDEAALVSLLESGHLAGAGLDTFDREPPGADAPVCRCQRVVLSPHIAGVTPESTLRMSMSCAENITEFLLRGRCGPDLVNPDWTRGGRP